MTYIITNSGNLSHSFARPFIDDEGMWHTYDGRGYTCKIGDIVWDFNMPFAAGKMILAVQSPYERFEYKMYAAGECKYFEATAGTGNPDDEYSRLTDPPTNHPDPMMFNANWQGDDGGFISWVSNENNTGVSSATTVLIKSKFYDLGKPILAAALIDEFIIAIHCKDGKAEFCEYEIKDDGTVSKKFQKDLKLEKTESKQPEIDRLAKKVKDLEDMPKSSKYSPDSRLLSYKTHPQGYNGKILKLDDFVAQSDEAYLDQIKVNKYCINWQRNYREKMFKRYMAAITKGITDEYIVDNYRASFDKSITLGLFEEDKNYQSSGDFLVHVGYKLTKNNLFSNKEYYSPNSSNGFAVFNLKIKWTNQAEIEKAIDNGITPIPKKNFSYEITHKKTKYFDPCQMFFYKGCKEDTDKYPNVGNPFYYRKQGNEVSLFTDSYYAKGVSVVTVTRYAVFRSEFESDDAFIFAEMVDGVPMWISAEVDSKIEIGFTYEDTFSIGHQLNWKEVV